MNWFALILASVPCLAGAAYCVLGLYYSDDCYDSIMNAIVVFLIVGLFELFTVGLYYAINSLSGVK